MPSSSRDRAFRRRFTQAAALLILGVVVHPSVSHAAANARNVVEVRMENEKFIPEHIKVKRGTTVRWVNTEKRTSHSVHFVAEGLPESDRMFPGESYERTFEKTGQFPYVCGPHPMMKGVVEVVE